MNNFKFVLGIYLTKLNRRGEVLLFGFVCVWQNSRLAGQAVAISFYYLLLLSLKHQFFFTFFACPKNNKNTSICGTHL